MSHANHRPVFYYMNGSRLIGRLMHLFYGLRFSRQVGGRFVTVWYPPTKQSARFDDPPSYLLQNIFDLERYRSEVSDDLVVTDTTCRREATWLDLGGPAFEKMRPENFDRAFFAEKSIESYATRFPFFQFSDEQKSKAAILAEVGALFRSMPHNLEVSEALKKARVTIGTDRFTAVHVRRSDVCDWLQAALLRFAHGEVTPERFHFVVANFVARVAPPEAYFPDIAVAIAAKQKIIFTADVPDAIAPFERHFGGEHFVDLSQLVTISHPIQKAFCDFNILTMANKVVSTGSIFARAATIFGSSPLSNVALCTSAEELGRFAVDLLAPELATDKKMRGILLQEIERSYALRNVPSTGRGSKILPTLGSQPSTQSMI